MIGSLLFFALAASPEILPPPWPLSPDGDLVAVRGGVPLGAAGGTVEPVAPGLYRVLPAEGVAEVRLSAGAATAAARVEPAPAGISVAVTPARPVKGRDREVALEIAVSAAPGEDVDPRPPEVVASSGRVIRVTRSGPGRFRAVYELAATRYPEVVVLLALSHRCPTCPTPRAIGYAVVPVAASIDLPGTAEPDVRTTVDIAGRRFGPAIADRSGRFTVPVVVPPGARIGMADSVDALGNRRQTEVDLKVPLVNQLACTPWPRTIPADGASLAAVWCVASSATGEAQPDAALVLAAKVGEISRPAPFRAALQRAMFRAPRGGGGHEAVLTVAYPDGGPASVGEVRVALATAAPAELLAEVPEPVALGATVQVETVARDRYGDVVGRPSGPTGTKEGFVASDRFVARTEPGDYVQRAPLHFALAPGAEAATLSLHRDGAHHWIAAARTVDGRPAAGVALRFGSGASATTDARGEARVPAARDREGVTAANGARAAGFDGIASSPAPFELTRVVTVALRPSAPVDVSARVEGGYLHWRIVDAGGGALGGRAVALRSRTVTLGPPEPEAGGGRAQLRGGRGAVAVIDAATGIAAVVEVP